MKLNKKIICGVVGGLVLSVSLLALNASALGNNVPGVATETDIPENDYIPSAEEIHDLSIEPEIDFSNVSVETETYVPENNYIPTQEEIDILEDTSRLRGNSKPTDFHDLAKSNYYYNFSLVTSTNTKRYFSPNSKGELRVQISDIDSSDKKFKISCYHINGTLISTWEGKPSDGYNALFKGLSTSSHYYFQFKSGFLSYIKGNGDVFH